MRRLRKFFGLPGRGRRLLVAAALLLVTIKLGLSLLPFQTFRRLLRRWSAPVLEPTAPHAGPSHEQGECRRNATEEVVWAVRTASRSVPCVADCLTCALTVQLLLRRRHQSTSLRIGVARGEAGKLEAHAWIESQGNVLIGGGPDMARYTLLPPLER